MLAAAVVAVVVAVAVDFVACLCSSHIQMRCPLHRICCRLLLECVGGV